MRELADAERIATLLRELGREADAEGVAYLTGGATAVLHGWRATTIDVDLTFEPESDRLLQAIVRLKDELRVNVELVSPGDFIPLPDGWRDRSIFIAGHGRLSFYHFDPYAQVLAKVERAHPQDLDDVRSFVAAGLVDPTEARRMFEKIEPKLYRFPAVDPRSFRTRVERAFGADDT
ncbi:MAG TPA: DUF6036 family nucleotidyltransferase [Gaiellaceae bacterium]